MQCMSYLTSRYLNEQASSERRATVLSFRGLATNLSYGTVSLLFGSDRMDQGGWKPPSRPGKKAHRTGGGLRAGARLVPHGIFSSRSDWSFWSTVFASKKNHLERPSCLKLIQLGQRYTPYETTSNRRHCRRPLLGRITQRRRLEPIPRHPIGQEDHRQPFLQRGPLSSSGRIRKVGKSPRPSGSAPLALSETGLHPDRRGRRGRTHARSMHRP